MSPEGNSHNFIPSPKRTKFYFLLGFNFSIKTVPTMKIISIVCLVLLWVEAYVENKIHINKINLRLCTCRI